MKLTFVAVAVILLSALLVSADGSYNSTILRKRSSILRKRITSSGKGKGTWYAGSDMADAACYGRNYKGKRLGDYTPKDSEMIGAVPGLSDNNYNLCFQCIQITNTKNSKTIIVRIVDECVGCGKGSVDLSKSAFTSLGVSLNVGVISIVWKTVTCPKNGKWNQNPPV
ncbi:RlpA-like double-psi beta-barrel-protein domain-containing protein-containing protein [Jimgerdemannia flammicorona]|uniref:RlpA-like double-psi beta-barrel-protein domain-containing protein-containing protein n=1 Tax=Jimgerdemannia flammicorona TaxID=994334 RepID=A0A433QUS6_9FUNG|nr:RlpA-like double-psi beta-barrel-protein domain-containing protein-containing protein [Jimgerdemannia flammicorona]